MDQQFNPNQQRIIRPDQVRTLDEYATRKPDRFFYICYGETIWECDGYKVVEQGREDKTEWTILIICPECGRNLKLDSTEKKLKVDERGLELAEPMACPWPGEFSTPCNFQVMLEPPKRSEKTAVVTTLQGVNREVQIDAVAKRV
jgi:hypothetical protein